MSIFEHNIERRKTRSVKWDTMEIIYGIEDASDILPMWIADMDFAAPEVVVNAMKERLDHPVFGYSYICEGCKDAVRSWFSERHEWELQNEWMQFHHGVVPAIASVVETFTSEEMASSSLHPPILRFSKFPNARTKYGRMHYERTKWCLLHRLRGIRKMPTAKCKTIHFMQSS